ncbi:Derlin 1 [Apophysomyces ossiformis]|uniref:Derlin n=1 Tax=Apophysomyces ossiformis TaxID=679940 RepID=A0A8H7BFP2_9FUNG|nr:Derlin 1 [Apophysomyces ossiformis]
MPPTQPSARNEIVDWYTSIPPVTKAIFTLTILVTASPALQLVHPSYMILLWGEIRSKLQLWRLITPFFLHGFGLGFAMNLYLIYRHSLQLETQVFMGRTADYVYFLLVTCALQLAAAKFLDLLVMSNGLIMAVIYLWAQYNSEAMMNFMFGITFKALYLPWALVAYDFLLSGAVPKPSLLGIATAHIYYYFTAIYPRQGGVQYLKTPAFLHRLFPPVPIQGNHSGAHVWPTQQQRQQQTQPGRLNPFGGHSWGRGHRLGQ